MQIKFQTDNGIEINIKLTDEQREQLQKQLGMEEENKIEKISTAYDRAKRNEPYFTIDNFGIHDQIESGCGFDKELYEKTNYFLSEELATQEDKIQTLRRKLKRFSYENGGDEIDWSSDEQLKHYIGYSSYSDEFEVDWIRVNFDFEKVYFISEEVAKKAMETFKNELDEVKKYFI